MSDAPDQESKTEQPTEKRLQDALDEGKVPLSQEAANLAFLVALVLCIDYLASYASSRISARLLPFIERPYDFRLETVADAAMLAQALWIEIIPMLVVLLLPFLVIGVGGAAFQSPIRFAFKRIEPDVSRISISQGWKRITGVSGLLMTLKGVMKLVFVGTVGASFTMGMAAKVMPLPTAPAQVLTVQIMNDLSSVAWIMCGAVAALAIIDIVASRFMWERGLRMTREEVRNEMKQTEGDPLVNARRLSIARNRVRKRMLANVPQATLVVANPTHYAVALRYVRSEGRAPVVVAKGKDLIALQIRKVAETHGVPVAEDKVLARSLYNAVEVDQMIPPEFYRAVADLFILLRKRGDRRVAVDVIR